jgi:hypothetical protein
MTSPPPASPKLSQRQQLAVYFGFADVPGKTTPPTQEEREYIRARRIAGIAFVGLFVGLLWVAVGPIPALVVALIGAIWFGSALRTYGRR